MKMTNDHYAVLRDQIVNVLDGINKSQWTKDYDRICNEKGLSETRKLWDMYWACGGNKWKGIIFNGNTYGGDYNDKHITTALKKVYNELRAM